MTGEPLDKNCEQNIPMESRFAHASFILKIFSGPEMIG
jgi:hypothetical protein